MTYQQVQQIAKDTMAYIEQTIRPGMNLRDIRRLCEEKMLSLGADSFWYWDIGAFVFSGDETAVSVSGAQYKTADKIITPNDIITIDLSPQHNNIWGDFARTIVLQNGTAATMENITNVQWQAGLKAEMSLHRELLTFVTKTTTFHELYEHMNKRIRALGFLNLDFAGNLGHSIATAKEDRIYIEKGNFTRLSDVPLFTFEPHIGKCGSPYGYKQEDIYYFDNEKLRIL